MNNPIAEESLQRFLDRQETHYPTALQELKRGKKRSHYIWFIFPQLRGLGKSEMAYVYGIDSLDEARAYLAHPVLRARLTACCEALLTHKEKAAEDILGDIDAMKLRSSMTLFALADEENALFRQILEAFFGGEPDRRTLELLRDKHID